MILVLDIDGTLADISHRQHFIDRTKTKKPDWKSFHNPANVEQDTPYPEAIEALPNLMAQADDVYFISGRDEALRETTLNWLKTHYGLDISPDHLFLRPPGNYMPANEYKKTVVDQLAAQGGDYVFVDDDPRNVEMMSEYGNVLHAPGCWKDLTEKKGAKMHSLATAKRIIAKKILAEISHEDLEYIYEDTYKYQMLKQEERLGDYGVPQVLPDAAYMELARVEARLYTLLEDVYDDMIKTYDGWINRHTPTTSDFYDMAIDSLRQYESDLKYEKDAIERLTWLFGEDKVKDLLVEYLRDNFEGVEDPDYDPFRDKIKYLNQLAPVGQLQQQLEFMPEKEVPAMPSSEPVLNLEELDLEELWKIAEDAGVEITDIIDEAFEHLDFLDDVIEQEAQLQLDSYEDDSALGGVEEMKERLESEWEHSPEELGNNIILFQEALTTAHNNGEMAEYLLDDHRAVRFLHDLSGGPKVEEWNTELEKILGYPLGSRLNPKRDVWVTPASKHLRRALRIIADAFAGPPQPSERNPGSFENACPMCGYHDGDFAANKLKKCPKCGTDMSVPSAEFSLNNSPGEEFLTRL